MHRSGTSLLAKVLEKGGIFMGVMKDHNFEAIHFLSENQKALFASNSNWLEPAVPQPKDWTQFSTEELYHEHFLINGRWQRMIFKLKNPNWGFKDPRNTFTLPMWLHHFPNARVIHLTRESQAVATSLKKRNNRKGEVHDPRLDDLDFNKRLWQLYIDQGKSYEQSLKSNYLEIEYEKLIAFDEDTVSQLEDFCSCPLMAQLKYFVR